MLLEDNILSLNVEFCLFRCFADLKVDFRQSDASVATIQFDTPFKFHTFEPTRS